MIDGLLTALLLAGQSATSTDEQKTDLPFETRIDIEGWDTICKRSGSRANSVVDCKAFRAVQGGVIILDYRAKSLKITVVANDCSGPNAIEETDTTAPLAIALPWTINRYRGSCKLPALSSLPANTEQFESLMQLMVAN